MAHPVNWFQIEGGEGGALASFYGKVFRWKMKGAPDGSGMMMVNADKGGIAGGIGSGRDGGHAVSVYVGVADIDKQLAVIAAEGGQPAMPKMELPAGMGSIATFVDPAGNMIGLWQAGKPARKPAAKKTAKRAAKKTAKKTAKKAGKPKGKSKAAKKK